MPAFVQACQLKRDPTEDEVKNAVDVEVAEIMQKKDQKRDIGKVTIDDSSDEEFLEQRLDSLEEFKSWSTNKISSMENAESIV